MIHAQIWSTHLAAAGCRPRTIRERMWQLGALHRHVGTPLVEATRTDLIAWLGRPGLAPSTRQNYRAMLHTFYTWMHDEGHRADNPAARLPRTVVRLVEPDPVTTADIQRLLESGIYRHTRTKVVLYSYQGMRASEIAAVHGSNIDLERGLIYMLDAKGGREVWRPMHPIVHELAHHYPRDSWWFPSPQGGHVAGRTVSRVIATAMRRAGIPHRPHHMRAWFATEMLRAGVDAATVQFAMRHASAQTLRRYAIPSQDMARDGMAVLPVVELPTRSGRQRAA